MPNAAASSPPINELADRVRGGDRQALARAITLAESTRHDHRERAEALLDELLPHTGRSIRLGISGAPGVGKSTFIEAFGLHLVDEGKHVAVLAVDPSSVRTGGSILGDKTRMEQLSKSTRAFIRPSPAGTTHGGIARRSREVLLLCEAAGFDVVLVETVGVGQSEVAVAEMTDLFILLVSPGGGDELQGIKRGIMELADLVVVTKSDGELANAARHTVADHKKALQLLRPPHPELSPTTLAVSSVTGSGIDTVIDRITSDHGRLERAGELDRLRSGQRRRWLWEEITAGIRTVLADDERIAHKIAQLEGDVEGGRVSPITAASVALAELRRPLSAANSEPRRSTTETL